jgi:hypothetical protein
MVFLSGGKDEDKGAFLAEQKQFLSGTFQVDEATGLMIYVPHFQHMFAQLNIPVLAIFGEKGPQRELAYHCGALFRDDR